MNILVTGLNGFIGSNFKKNIFSDNLNIIDYNENLIGIHEKKIKTDFVLHLAAKTSPSYFYKNSYQAYKTNLNSLLSILSFCKKNNCKFIFISSCGIYKKKNNLIKEDDDKNPSNPYNMTKYIGELLCEQFNKDFDIPITILRLFNVYGIGQKKEFIVPYIFNCFKDQKEIHLNKPLDLRDFIFVDDVCHAIIKVIYKQDSSFKVYNVGSGKLLQIGLLAEKISNLFGVDFLNYNRSQIDNSICADLKIIKNELNWSPKIEIDDGLKIIYEFYRKYNYL